MTRPRLIALVLAADLATAGLAGTAGAAPKPPAPTAADQKEADRRFKNGVALFKQAKYADALAEFERAYAAAPHPLVLYNIAGCYRELARHVDAVKYYQRFLAEGAGKVPAPRLAAAQTELDELLTRVARVTVKAEAVPGAALFVDGAPAGVLPLDAPLILAPGEHTMVARAEGRAEIERKVRVAAGEQLPIELTFGAPLREGPLPGGPPPGGPSPGGPGIGIRVPGPAPRAPKRFAVYGGFGTNALRVAETGAPAVGLGVAIGSRLELGVDATLVAYAIMPSVRVRLAGDTVAVHAIAAAPIALTDGSEMEPFVAAAIGVGLRLRATETLVLRLESYASFAGGGHGTTVPTFIGGELWF